MQKEKALVFSGLILLVLLCAGAYGQNAAGDVWIMKEHNVVALGQEFVISVHLHTGEQQLSSYTVDLSYDNSLVQPLAAGMGPDGLGMFSCGTDTIPLRATDYDVRGSMQGRRGPNLNVAVFRFKALKYGKASFTLDIVGLQDQNLLALISTTRITGYVSIVDPTLTYGDVNADGLVNIIDAMTIATRYLGGEAADVNGDYLVNILDALLVARYSAGLISEFPVVAGLTRKNTELVPVYPGGIPPFMFNVTESQGVVRLRDAAGNPLIGKEVVLSSLYFAGIYRVTTDNYGLVVTTLPAPFNNEASIDASFAGERTLMSSSCSFMAKSVPPPTGTPQPPTPTPTPTSSLASLPYQLSPDMANVNIIPGSATTIARVTGWLPDGCRFFSSWGAVQRTGNTFTVNSESCAYIGTMCTQMLVSFSHDYELGALAPGDYEFNFLNWGSLLKSVSFTVPSGS